MRKIFLLLVCLGICSTARGQFYSYSQLDSLVNSWATSIQADYPSRAIKMKSIDYPNYCYRIVGYFLKGVLAEGQIVKIIDCKDEAHTLVEGKVSYEQNRLIVTGIKYDHSDDRIKMIYGSFIISNSDDGQMCYKPKKAKGIVINDYALQYYRGYYMNCPVIVCLGNKPYIGVDGKTGGWGYTEFTAPLVRSNLHDIGYSAPYELLLTTSQNALMKWSDGLTFRGEVMPEVDEDGLIFFHNLAGVRNGFDNDLGFQEQRVVENNSAISIELIDNPDNSLIKKEKYSVSNKSLIPKNSYWDIPLFLKNTDSYYAEFRNGDSFEGKVNIQPDDEEWLSWTTTLKEGLYQFNDGAYFEGVFGASGKSRGTLKYPKGDRFEGTFINESPAQGVYYYHNGDKFNGDLQNGKGTYYYANGDRFVGNINSNWGSLFFNGTTYCKNGKVLKGNWLKISSFTNDQRDQLKRCKSPSDAALKASFFTRINNYIVIDHLDSTCSFDSKFFDPDSGDSHLIYADYVVYNKNTRNYFFVHSDSRNNLSLAYAINIDGSGRHLHEVIYDKNGIPKVFTHFSYYSNHRVQTIDSKYFSGEKRVVCNFFSDGEIRSAYEYGKGNRGKTVLRRSKEAHPSYGGYTSKLYDLDGNYERSINWGIGGENWLGIPYIETKPTTTIIDVTYYSHMSTDNPIFLKLIELVESIR